MKTIPIVTILLILDMWFLQRVTGGSYRWWRLTLERMPGGNPLIAHLEHWFALLGVHTAILFAVCLWLVIINWKNRLWYPWLPAGITLFWIITLWFSLKLN